VKNISETFQKDLPNVFPKDLPNLFTPKKDWSFSQIFYTKILSTVQNVLLKDLTQTENIFKQLRNDE
jgi:hypothetical protein